MDDQSLYGQIIRSTRAEQVQRKLAIAHADSKHLSNVDQLAQLIKCGQLIALRGYVLL